MTSNTTQAGTLSDETIQNSRDTVEKTAGVGIIMAKNTGGLLLAGMTSPNVFGCTSTKPIYSDTGPALWMPLLLSRCWAVWKTLDLH